MFSFKLAVAALVVLISSALALSPTSATGNSMSDRLLAIRMPTAKELESAPGKLATGAMNLASGAMNPAGMNPVTGAMHLASGAMNPAGMNPVTGAMNFASGAVNTVTDTANQATTTVTQSFFGGPIRQMIDDIRKGIIEALATFLRNVIQSIPVSIRNVMLVVIERLESILQLTPVGPMINQGAAVMKDALRDEEAKPQNGMVPQLPQPNGQMPQIPNGQLPPQPNGQMPQIPNGQLPPIPQQLPNGQYPQHLPQQLTPVR